MPGTVSTCYSGPPGTQDVGTCHTGTAMCSNDGVLGPCEGEVVPQAETCESVGDEDCDGAANEDGVGCVCVPGEIAPCYTGPQTTVGVGSCHAGVAMCQPTGTALGPCVGEVAPASENCATPEDEDCDGNPGCPPPALCSRRFGGAGNDGVRGVVLDPQGNIILAGGFNTEIDFGGGPLTRDGLSPSYVAKLDPNCNHIWSKMLGGTKNSSVTVMSVAVDSDGNVVVSGDFRASADFGGGPLVNANPMSSDAFLLKLDPQGNHLWSKRFGDLGEDSGACVSVDKDANVLQVLSMDGNADFGAGPVPNGPVYLAKFAPGGNLIWANGFGGASFRNPAPNSAGNIVLAGRFEQTIDLGGGPLVSAGVDDVFLAKLDPAGDHLFSKRFGDAQAQYVGDCNTVAVGPGDAIAFTGTMFGAVDFGGGPHTSPIGATSAFIARFDAMGNYLWSKAFGGGIGTSVGVDALGNTILAGYFGTPIDLGGGALTSAGLPDLFLGKFEPTGSLLWSRRIGNADDQKSPLLSVASDQILLAAWFKGTLDLGNGPLVATDIDVLLAKLPP